MSLCWLISLFHHHCSTASTPLPPPPLSQFLPALLLRLSAFTVSGGTLQSVMNTKASLQESSVLVKNGEAQEIPPLRNYLCLTMLTCFCPAWPINIVALVFSVLAQKSYDEQDYDGSKRLGQKALHLGIVSFVIGLMIITACITVHFTMHVV
ncbi:transmembrane protein 233 [Trachinotus anak]|uniref:transmembrane protein 233 n=1 Tax=Trachinotus anak TaxID=443729 RepID=UPI0039F1BA23